MTQTYTISGISCGSCVQKLNKTFLSHDAVQNVDIDKDTGRVDIESTQSIPQSVLDELIQPFGKYSFVDAPRQNDEIQAPSATTYRPLILVISFILLAVAITQINLGYFDPAISMRYFMGGFFLAFSFFKLLDIPGFAQAYQGYDLIAAKWPTWGKIYPFVELLLGIAYLVNFNPIITNVATIVIMGVGSIGVIRAVMNKTKIQCACLGTGFNLPMSSVTIIEDLSMLVMAIAMLLLNF